MAGTVTTLRAKPYCALWGWWLGQIEYVICNPNLTTRLQNPKTVEIDTSNLSTSCFDAAVVCNWTEYMRMEIPTKRFHVRVLHVCQVKAVTGLTCFCNSFSSSQYPNSDIWCWVIYIKRKCSFFPDSPNSLNFAGIYTWIFDPIVNQNRFYYWCGHAKQLLIYSKRAYRKYTWRTPFPASLYFWSLRAHRIDHIPRKQTNHEGVKKLEWGFGPSTAEDARET